MEDKDIEQLLKESAEEVKGKDFSERWESIKGRINSAQEIELKETVSETVLATSVNTNVSKNPVRRKIIISLCAIFLFIGICLAIVLPITLKKNDTLKFLTYFELSSVTVSENEFYEKLDETDLKIVSLEKFEADNYILLYTKDGLLVGGKSEIIDEVNGVVAEVVFYDSIVTSEFDIGTDYKTYAINGFNIVHKAELTGDFYTINAKASGANITYELKCLAVDENIESFFEKLFG